MYLSVQIIVVLGRVIVPWTIVDFHEENVTFSEFFCCIKAGQYNVEVTDDLKRARLLKTFVGNKTDTLIVSGVDQLVIPVCSQFGIYVKFTVELILPVSTSEEVLDMSVSRRPNAFDVMMAAQRQVQLADNGLPFQKAIKNGKDRLYNDVISLMKEMGIKWTDPLRYGVPYLEVICDALWYIDGHQDTISDRAPRIPEIFSRFVGYNCPEKSKHRKRTKDNLSCSEISAHSLALQDCLQASWFKKESYRDLKTATTELLSSLSVYATYLQEKNKAQKLHHAMNCPSATPSESSHTEYIPKTSTQLPGSMIAIDRALQIREPYQPIAVMDFAPVNRKQRYRCVVRVCTCMRSLCIYRGRKLHKCMFNIGHTYFSDVNVLLM